MGFRRFVNVVEVVAGVAVLVFVIALFANEPGGGSGGAARSGPGYDVYLANCARCHGQDGQGGVGPKLAGGAVVKAFPNRADQIRLVEDGKGTMPSFKGDLSTAEIQEVVAYTRTQLK
jgi:mono/diheme cytochrome c family protein